MLSVRASEKGISFSCRMPPEVPDALVGDQVRLRQVLLNLAGNGIKFTDRGEVTVSVRVDRKTPKKPAWNLPCGTRASASRHRTWNASFIRSPKPMPRPPADSAARGWGLRFASSLVGMMGGRIWVESEPGKGSTFHFTVRLPLAKELPPGRRRSTFPQRQCRKLRILLVEDNPANQKLAAFILKDRGHAVEIAGDGQQGLCMTQQNRYDVILMDVQMPGMDGLEATAAIRSAEIGNRRMPIIAMTAHAMKGDRERCLAAGMDGYLSKPIDAHETIALVESLAAGATAAGAARQVLIRQNPSVLQPPRCRP